MKNTIEAPSSERGAVLVHVALALIALMSFSTFVVDYGVLWTARRQAQNAADAGALAGAVALAFDNPSDFSNSGPAKTSAYQVLMSHPIWGQQPVVDITNDITFPACPDDATTTCVRVDVYRNTAHGNALPMIFGQLVGLNTQNVRAMAMAKVAIASATDCLKPWGLVDKWDEYYPAAGPWTNTSVFQKYLQSGPNAGTPDPSIAPPDQYVPPTTSSPGSGFHPFNPDKSFTPDYGRQLSLTEGSQGDFQYASGWFAPLALADSTGGKDYLNNIKGCVGTTYQIGQTIEVDTEPGKKTGPTQQAVATDVDSLIQRDPGAYWDASLNGGFGGVAGSNSGVSPRIVAVPLIDPDVMTAFQKGGRTTVVISNIMAFFIERYDGPPNNTVVGRLVTTAGLFQVGSGPPIGGQSSFLQAIILIR
jgi:Flp pilus assembly protein TadG